MDNLMAWLGLSLTGIGVLAAAAPGLRAPLWALAGLLCWGWSRGFTGVEPAAVALWVTLAAGAVAIDHFTGTPAAKRIAVPGPARVSVLGGAVLGAAALGPAGVILGALVGAAVGLAIGGYGLPAPGAGWRAVLGPWLGTLAQAGTTAAMAAWLAAWILAKNG